MNNHISRIWDSQPVLNNRLSATDFMFGFAILASGNNYGKVALMSTFANLQIISKSSFHRLQKYIYVPEICNFWTSYQKELASSFSSQKLVVLGMYCYVVEGI